ncbi:MAG: GyrI-like domain-containing protein [Chloroflexi bacterium]|nr:GyrI-like domain-containing protein [Chloroflexota bacterium]
MIPSAATVVDAALRSGGLQPHDDLIVLYRMLRPGVFRLRIGRPADGAPPAGLERFALPAGLTATLLFTGPYGQLGYVTQRLFDWCAGQGHTRLGESWEIYHHLETPDDPATCKTSVGVLLLG